MHGINSWTRRSFGAIAILAIASTVHGGGLGFLEAQSDTEIDGAVAAAVSSDGAHVYVLGERLDALAVYERDSNPVSVDFGKLTFVEVENDGLGGVDGLRTAQDVAVSPDGDCVYVAGERDDAVAAFERDAVTGEVDFIEAEFDGLGGVDNLRNPNGVAVSGDSEHVYVTSEQDDSIVVFDRNNPDCDLTFVEFEVDGAGGVDGLGRPRGVVVSADGNNVYTAGGTGNDNDAVAVFSRSAITGELTFVEFHDNGVAGVEGIAAAFGIALSPDDANLYVAGRDDKSVAVFTRDTTVGPTLGELTFLEREKDGGGVDGLKGARDVAVSPDGAYVYAVGRDDDGLAVFRRDALSGQIAFLEVHKDGDDGVEGLNGPSGVAVSADGAHVYAASRIGIVPNEGVAAIFTADTCGNGTLGSDEQCDDGGVIGGDGCSATCQLELCGATPAVGCRTTVLPGKALLKIKENDKSDNKDKFQWKWNKGAATTIAEYDDPVTSDSYVVCVYDDSGGSQPLLGLSVPAGGVCAGKACWTAKTNNFKYKDKAASPDGIEKAQLKEGLVAGKAKIQFKGKGAGLFFSLGGDVLGPAGLTLPVTVQVTNTETGTPICWESVHSIAQRNDAGQFTSRGD